jgi:hypothetical protein
MGFDFKTVEEARMSLHGRILRCPLDQISEDCPFHSIRKLSIEERLAWLESKTDQEVVDLYQQHILCLNNHFSKQTK